MKNYFLTIAALFVSFLSVTAQNSASDVVNKMSIADANALNGVAKPTINGIPYSQYKIQQDALKRQREAQATAQNQDIVTANAADAKPAPAKAQPAETKSENDGYSKPAPEKIQAAVTKTEAKQPATASQVNAPVPPPPVETTAPAGGSNTKGGN